MARPREFDIDQAVEKAMHIFWRYGFDASMPVLLDGMGLTRGSLYKAFYDKKTLFLRALERYENDVIRAGVARLAGPALTDGEDRIMAMFSAVFDAINVQDRRGCLLCSVASGAEMADPEIAAVVQDGLVILRDGIEAALGQSSRHATLTHVRRRELADMLLTHYIGLRILSRSNLPSALSDNGLRQISDLLRVTSD